MIKQLLAILTPHAGRMTPSHAARFGAAVGSVGYLAMGPFALIIGLPKRLQKADPPPPSLDDFNRALAAAFEAAMAQDSPKLFGQG